MDEKVKGTLDKTRPRGPRSQKMRALLAGGLVLGVGGAITLATWNDSEYATGTFGTGTFNLEGSSITPGITFIEHPVGTPAVLTFAVLATLLTPGDVVYAPFAVRLSAGTTNNAVVTISSTATIGTVADLTYTLIQPATFGCDANTTGTELVPDTTLVGTVPGSTTFNLVKGTPTTAAGDAVYLCFKVTAGVDIDPTQTTGTVTWQFAAVSQ